MKQQSITARVVSFSFEGHTVRAVLDKQGDYFFVGRDICQALGIKNPNVVMTYRGKMNFAKYEIIKDRMGRYREIRVLTLYEAVELIQRSRTPLPGLATWLVNEVSPALDARVITSERDAHE